MSEVEEDWRSIFRVNDGKKFHDERFMNKAVNLDCLKYMDSFPDDIFDLVVTDPPYVFIKHAVSRTHESYSEADTSILSTYFDDFFKKIFRILKNDGALYCFCDTNSFPVFYNSIKRQTSTIRDITWDKGHCKLGYTWRHQHESILFAPAKDYKAIKSGDGDVIKCDVVEINRRIHDAQKPIRLLRKIISKHGTGNLVFDPFGGSGSTAIAAGLTGNYYNTAELDKAYYEKMIRHIDSNLGVNE